LIHADNVNTLGGSFLATKKNAEAIVDASKEIGLEINADKSNYTVTSRDKNAGQNKNIKTDK
jgi:hypothetical protein